MRRLANNLTMNLALPALTLDTRKDVRRGEPEAIPVIAALPPNLQERCIAAPGLLAQIIVSKYCDHLPLYRQQSIFRNRYRVYLPRQSMARWMGLAADWLRPIYEEIRTGVMAGGYLQIDETPIRYLSPGYGQTKLGYFWTALSPGAMCSIIGKPAGQPTASARSLRPTSRALSNATPTRPMELRQKTPAHD